MTLKLIDADKLKKEISYICTDGLDYEYAWNQALWMVEEIIDSIPAESIVDKNKLLQALWWWDEEFFIRIFWRWVDEYFSNKNTNLENILAFWIKSIANL